LAYNQDIAEVAVRLERELLDGLIPEGEPPETLVPLAARLAAESLVDQPVLRRSYLWATAILQAGLRSTLPIPPRFSHYSAGFVALPTNTPPASPIRRTGNVSFGGYVLAEGDERTSVQLLLVGNLFVPVVVVYGRIELHGCPPHPINGASACWVKNGGSSAWSEGIVTARHVVAGLPLGSALILTPSSSHSMPTSATLVDIDEATIDAAILEISSIDWPVGVMPLTVHAPAAPGQAVTVSDRGGVAHPGTVLRVFHDGTYAGNLFGQRVIADCHGTAGDSGSLLVDNSSGNGVGIYMGTIPDGAGSTDGMFQDLSQVTSYFKVQPYL
jgi:hypothetical protein